MQYLRTAPSLNAEAGPAAETADLTDSNFDGANSWEQIIRALEEESFRHFAAEGE